MYQSKNFYTRVAVATLNQWAMDFEHNKSNIVKSIQIAKQKGCTYRVGPELEICGYSCEDHFLENDTVEHCWEVLYDILSSDLTQDIIVDLGMPVIHKNVLYNCRVICYNGVINLIRPKVCLADDGNYREGRWFTPWSKSQLEDYPLPQRFHNIRGQDVTQFGVAIIKTYDTEIGLEICEELWVPQPTSTLQALDGAEIIINSSGSHFQINKINQRRDLVKDLTRRFGAAYLFSNLRGCDGNRLYFDGISWIAVNGEIYQSSEYFSLKEVEVITHDLDLDEVRNHRINMKSMAHQAQKQIRYPRVNIPINMTTVPFLIENPKPIYLNQMNESQQVLSSISGYLWDYLRRSEASGFFLPLSGGQDSAASAICVYYMCMMVYKAIQEKDQYGNSEFILKELQRIVNDPKYIPKDARDISSKIFSTGYLQTANSSIQTRGRSKGLAEQIGSQHYEIDFENVFQSFRDCIKPQYINEGGTDQREDLALQNIQARTRMVLSYVLAQLTPWNNGKQGFYLVLGSSNLDESLRGYVTKYDCSSADINPLGSLTKNSIKKLLLFAYDQTKFSSILEIIEGFATPELRPRDDIQQQSSIQEMGMDFDDLETFGKLRKINKLGPVGMFRRLLPMWQGHLSTKEIANKVKTFFKFYAINRHKNIVLTPSIHVESHSNDDNRYDLRQFLYNCKWPFQFKKIDQAVLQKEEQEKFLNQIKNKQKTNNDVE